VLFAVKMSRAFGMKTEALCERAAVARKVRMAHNSYLSL
jgi:hypothetical protein